MAKPLNTAMLNFADTELNKLGADRAVVLARLKEAFPGTRTRTADRYLRYVEVQQVMRASADTEERRNHLADAAIGLYRAAFAKGHLKTALGALQAASSVLGLAGRSELDGLPQDKVSNIIKARAATRETK